MKMLTKRRIRYFILLILFFSVIAIQYNYLKKITKILKLNPECPWCLSSQEEEVIFLPIKARYWKLFFPADPDLLSDLLWMKTTYYFGKHALSDREYPYLFDLLDIITDISPEWRLPYFYGIVLLPLEAGEVEGGLYLIDKGLRNIPDAWELWFYKGYYLWKFKNDYLGASRFLYKAGLIKGSPSYLIPLSATLAKKGGGEELAKRFLLEAMKNIKDSRQRRMILEKFRKITKKNESAME